MEQKCAIESVCSGRVLTDSIDYKSVLPGMRIVLDEMKFDPYPVAVGTQGTIEGRDDIGDLMISWDSGSGLKLLEIDSFHVVSAIDELEESFEHLGKMQKKGYSICPRCGKSFDVRRGAVSRRIKKPDIMICDLCGQQEAIEDFFINGKEKCLDINVFVPKDNNRTGFNTSINDEDGRQKLDVTIKSIGDWYVVKLWQGRLDH